MTSTIGVPAIKRDPFTRELPVDIDQHQSIDVQYEIENKFDTRQINRVYGDCIEIEYPVQSVDALNKYRLIETQFAHQNADNLDSDRMIDQAIYNLIPSCLTQEGRKLPNDQTLAARVSALILKQVRNISSTRELLEYLKNNPKSRELYGLTEENGLSKSTLSRARKEFDLNTPAAQAAICRLKHVLYRNGILTQTLSDTLNNEYTLNQPIPLGDKLPNKLRYRALLNWCDLLLEQLTNGLSFDRASNTSHTIREIVAALAWAALHDNPNKSHCLANLQYQEDIAPFNYIKQIINNNLCKKTFHRSIQSINQVGTQMCKNLIQFAAEELGFFSKPLDVALDPTWIPINKDTDPEDVPGAMGHVGLNEGGGFYFSSGVSFTPMSRFSLGVKLLTDKSRLPNAINSALRLIQDNGEIGWVVADREFDEPKIIEIFRLYAEDTWVIRLRKHSDMIDSDKYDRLQEDGKAVLSFGNTEINAFWRDTSELNRSWVLENEDSEFIVISGMPIDKNSISQLSAEYAKRWSSETHIRQLKNDYSLRASDISGPEHLFLLNVASAFYNINKIIYQALSPQLGLPLRPKHYEVLLAIADSTFSHRSFQRSELK